MDSCHSPMSSTQGARAAFGTRLLLGRLLAPLLLLCLPLSALSVPVILNDYRAVAIEGWVLSPDRPNGPVHTLHERAEVNQPHQAGVFFDSVSDHANQIMNSHATQQSFVSPFRPFQAYGEAQAQFRNFQCCPVQVIPGSESAFDVGNEFIVEFRIDETTEFLLAGRIGVLKGQWDPDNPLTSVLDVLLQLSRLDANAPNTVLSSHALTQNDLIRSCTPSPTGPPCPPLQFDGEHFVSIKERFLLQPGDYRLEAHAYALNYLPPSELPSWKDGAGVFDFTFEDVPEPPTALLMLVALLAMAGQASRLARTRGG